MGDQADLSTRGTADRGTGGRATDTASSPAHAPTATPKRDHPPPMTQLLARLTRNAGVTIMDLIDPASVRQWDENPIGFEFRTKRVDELAARLDASRAFGRIGNPIERVYKHDGRHRIADVAFREWGRPDSLHVLLFRDPGIPSVVHLDSKSIAVGRDSRTGGVIYADDLADHVRHISADLVKRHRK